MQRQTKRKIFDTNSKIVISIQYVFTFSGIFCRFVFSTHQPLVEVCAHSAICHPLSIASYKGLPHPQPPPQRGGGFWAGAAPPRPSCGGLRPHAPPRWGVSPHTPGVSFRTRLRGLSPCIMGSISPIMLQAVICLYKANGAPRREHRLL